MFQLLLQSFLLGDIVDDAQHQLVTVDLNGSGIRLNMAGGTIGKAVNKVERLMAAGQRGNRGHNGHHVSPQGIDFPGMLAAHTIMRVTVKIERSQVGINNLTIAGRID